jgi:hypothetical protein
VVVGTPHPVDDPFKVRRHVVAHSVINCFSKSVQLLVWNAPW